MKRVDEDGWPTTPGEIRELATGTPDEVVEFRMPLRGAIPARAAADVGGAGVDGDGARHVGGGVAR